MRLVGLSLAIGAAAIATALAITPAAADCAEDLTRIQLGAAKASADVQATVKGLVATAEARMKALDTQGCRSATAEAMKLLGLSPLAPITLSTPVPGPDRNPHPPAPPAQASAPPTGQPGDQTPTKQEKKPDDTARTAPTGPASPHTPSGGPVPAVPAPTAKTEPQPPAGKDWYVLTSNLIGKPVTSQDQPGDSIGVIKSVAIDTTNQQAVLVLVETGGFLGIGADVIAIPFSALMFNKDWDRPAIQANTEVIRSGPRVTIGNVPKLLTDPAWRKEVSEHFGMPLTVSAPAPAPGASTAPQAVAPKEQAPAAPTAAAPAAPAAAPAAGDPAKGHAYIKQTCAGCHTFDANGGTRVGPNLHNVLGRHVASVPGFSYSQGLKQHGGVWTPANLDQFLQSPQHFAAGTMMAFPGIPSAEERANVIAYLKAIETGQGAQQ